MLSTLSNSAVSALAVRAACSSPARHVAPVNWAHVVQAPPDAILGVAAAYRADPRKDKVNLSVGAYRDEKGRPYVLQCVRKAEAALVKNQPGHEYLPVCFFPPSPFSGALNALSSPSFRRWRELLYEPFANDLMSCWCHFFFCNNNRLADWSRSMWGRV